jgi:hypothetical protein
MPSGSLWVCYTVDDKFVPTFRRNVKVKYSLEEAMKAQRGSRGIALLFL